LIFTDLFRYTWGLGSMGQLGHCSLQSGDKELIPRRVVSLEGTPIKDIACGGVHTCALTDRGGLYAWGGGNVGQLGLGPMNGFFFCTSDGSSEMMLRNIPVLVIPYGVQLVTCGNSHTLVSMRDGRIYGWGYNSYGQAANAKSTYSWFPSPVDWCVHLLSEYFIFLLLLCTRCSYNEFARTLNNEISRTKKIKHSIRIHVYYES
jgi:alpha-tubulin suppressor-like RCC1 family protein